MYNRKPLAFALLAVFLASTCAYAQNPPSPTCCERNPGWTVGLESGLTWLATEEIVEARPEYAAAHLSALTWQARTVVAGLSLRYDTGSILRISGGFWSLVSAGDGSLVNLDYLDSSSEAVTHRSVSPAYLAGLGWQLCADFMLLAGAVGDVLVRSFARLEYRGNYHAWRARGGEYEYPGKQGSFDDGEELVRYLVLHQGFDIGVSVELGKMYDGLHGRLGAAVSLLTLIDDRDTHVLSDTDYYNTYRRGYYVRPEIAVGMGFEGRLAVEVFFEPVFQFESAETRTRIKTSRGVHVPEEEPNFKMELYQVGIRLVRPLPAT